MKQYVCGVCGYVCEGAAAPDNCPQCGAAAAKFSEKADGHLDRKSVV